MFTEKKALSLPQQIREICVSLLIKPVHPSHTLPTFPALVLYNKFELIPLRQRYATYPDKTIMALDLKLLIWYPSCFTATWKTFQWVLKVIAERFKQSHHLQKTNQIIISLQLWDPVYSNHKQKQPWWNPTHTGIKLDFLPRMQTQLLLWVYNNQLAFKTL